MTESWAKKLQNASTGAVKRVAKLGILVASGAVSLTILKKWQEQKSIQHDLDSRIHWKFNSIIIQEESPVQSSIVSKLISPQTPRLTMLQVLQSLEFLAMDKKVTSLHVDFSGAPKVALGLGQIEELREAILEMKKKREKRSLPLKTVAYADSFASQSLYALASAFDEVRMEPTGVMPFGGLNVAQPFFKKLLDKLGVEVESITAGKYKSMGSNFSEETWPLPQRENLASLIQSLNQTLFDWIGTSRKLPLSGIRIEDPFQPDFSKEKANSMASLADISPLTAQEAKCQGLVDDISYKREFLPPTKEIKDLDAFDFRPEEISKNITFPKYCKISQYYANEMKKTRKRENVPLPAIGLVHLCGTINRNSDKVQKALLEAARDSKIEAIVLRVDTGGGDVQTSDQIWETVDYIRKDLKKPVFASYSNIAASGGVYATAGCDAIFANNSTITGSIGVASLRPYISEQALETLGITIGEIETSEAAKTGSILHKLSKGALKRYEKVIGLIYTRFKSVVSEGRNISMEEVEKLAQGQVFTADQAKTFGLVDHTGGGSLSNALKHAANFASKKSNFTLTPKQLSVKNLLGADIISFPKKKNVLETLLDPQEGAMTALKTEAIAELKNELSHAKTNAIFDAGLYVDINVE